jgi:predicted RNA-binding Zn ribbon-like protein
VACAAVTCQGGYVSFSFLSGSVALDLAGTLKWRRHQAEELLKAPADLQAWLEEGQGLKIEEVDDDDLRTTLALREAVYRLASDRVAGHRWHASSLGLLNDFAARPGVTFQLAQGGMSLRGDLEAALSDIARDATRVLADPDLVMKECAQEACTRLYLDKSRGARRTWCGMSECGNRAKAAAYRARGKRGTQRPSSSRP